MAIFVDASALAAIIRDEPEAEDLSDRLESDPDRITSELALWECAAVVARLSKTHLAAGMEDTRRFATGFGIRTIAIGKAEAIEAARAHRHHGKGTGARAQLNMGDCFAYACARTNNAQLLYKGDDFRHTDLA